MGGIGEHDPVVRQKICSGLEPLGILLDISSNGSNLLTINASEIQEPGDQKVTTLHYVEKPLAMEFLRTTAPLS